MVKLIQAVQWLYFYFYLKSKLVLHCQSFTHKKLWKQFLFKPKVFLRQWVNAVLLVSQTIFFSFVGYAYDNHKIALFAGGEVNNDLV